MLLILKKEGIIEKNSYERRVYESVNDSSKIDGKCNWFKQNEKF